MKEMNDDSIFSSKCSDTFFYGVSRALKIVIIEVETDENVSLMKFLDDSDCMSGEPECTINHNISLCRAQIEGIYVLVVEYRNMSKTFLVQIVKKWWRGKKYFLTGEIILFSSIVKRKGIFSPQNILTNFL